MSTLIALLADLATLSDDATLYAARPWSETSEAVCSSLREREVAKVHGSDLAYLLEVELAREVVGVWAEWRGGRQPARVEVCDAVIHYAENDAYLPVEAVSD